MSEARLERTRRAYGSPWVLALCERFRVATANGDQSASLEAFYDAANRCAQALLFIDDQRLTIPDVQDPYWERRVPKPELAMK